jgi:hypothetical protein
MTARQHIPDAARKSREARNRAELRETRARIERMQRAEVERLAVGKLADPGDLWLGGLTIDELLDGRGDVDTPKVASAIDSLIAAHPHWGAPKPKESPRYSRLQSGVSKPADYTPANWANALRPGRS